jgi:serine/threonine kinase PknH
LTAVLSSGDSDSGLSSGDSDSGRDSGRTEDEEGADPKAKKPDPKPVTYKGINLTDDYFLVMADDPLKPRDSEDDGYETSEELSYSGDDGFGAEATLSVVDVGKLVLLNNSQKGSLKTCRAETRFTSEVQLNQLTRGSQLCVYTDSGHIALVTYRGHSPKSDPSDYVKLDVTVWRNALEARES